MVETAFRDSFLEQIKSDLETYMTQANIDAKVHCTLDLSTYLVGVNRFQQDDIFVLVSLGNATRTSTEFQIWNTTIQMNVTCALNMRKKVYDILEKYVKETNLACHGVGTQSSGVYKYYASLNWATPFASNIIRTFNSQQVTDLNLTASCTYASEIFYTDDIPTITMGNTELKNVFSYQIGKESVCDAYTVLGDAYQRKFESYRTGTYTFQFIYDKNNTLHSNLLYPTGINKYSVAIGTSTFTAYVRVDAVFNIGNFTAVTLTIVR